MARDEAVGRGAMTMPQGTFIGVGVGPGDPELMTLKACRVIRDATAIAYPINAAGESLARDIAALAIPPGAMELPILIPMRTEREPARDAYDGAAATIAQHLDQGDDVCFLCEGDPFFYGSFMYLFARLAETHATLVVPGVTSLTACAAALGRPLAARNESLRVLPAPMAEERLAQEVRGADALAIIKVGRHFDKVRRVLRDAGLANRAAIVESATRTHQKVTPLEDVPEGARPYFSTILVYRGGEAW
jgi:precorrin-2/cobalt-factor-2 C20-methyltransferase